jgi:hypothetical protein
MCVGYIQSSLEKRCKRIKLINHQGRFMKITVKAILLALAATASVSTFAQTKTETGLNYNQVGLGYASVTSTVSNKDYTFSGFGVGGSVLVGSNFLLSGSTLSATGDVGAVKLTISQTNIGVGARAGIGAQTDVYGYVSYLDAKVAALDAAVSDNGYGFTAGVKTMIAPGFTASVFAGQSKLSKSDSSTSFGAGLDFNVAPNVLVGGAYVSGKDTRQFNVTVAYQF